jgi:hypothetical protein
MHASYPPLKICGNTKKRFRSLLNNASIVQIKFRKPKTNQNDQKIFRRKIFIEKRFSAHKELARLFKVRERVHPLKFTTRRHKKA